MPQPLLPMFPSDVTEINELVSFAKREGTVYYFNGPMPVFSHAETDRASFRMGHVSVNTTNKYLTLDLEAKRAALAKAKPILARNLSCGSWRTNPDVIRWLESL